MSAETDPGAPALRVVGGSPTDEELAAVIAVVSEQYAQEVANAVQDEAPVVDVWTRSRRLRRTPRGPWGRFSG